MPGTGTRPRHARLAGLALAVLALAGVAACGTAAPSGGVLSLDSPSPKASQAGGAPAGSDPADAMAAYSACLREHGVDLAFTSGGGEPPSTAPGAGGQVAQPAADPEALAKADEACRHLLPAGGMGGPQASADPQAAERLLTFAKCMRDHGVAMPDPVIVNGQPAFQLDDPSALNPGSDTFKTAQEACDKATPGGAPMVIGGTQP